MTSLRNQFWQYLAEVVTLCLIYIGAAKLANGIIGWNELVLPILPLAGITQAALFLRGWRILPGILLGEFFAILSAEVSWSVACGMALGCTLQGLCGAGLARRWGVCFSLGGSRDVFGFIVCMVMLSTLISPTIGITNLYLGGQVDRGSFAAMWWSCWAGNAIGVLVVTALLLVWCYPATHPSWRDWSRSKKQIIWAAVWLISLCTVSWLVFGSPTAQGMLLPFGETYHVVSVHYPL
ncbi:MAG TPA: MASE1 domain-containing protein, partial [Candidatus Sericytochromatia bacterium]